MERKDRGNSAPVRHDWQRAEAQALYGLRFADLMFQAQSVHRKNFDPSHVETASLLSIKTGGCPEDCGYCSQSAHLRHRPERDPLDGSRRRRRHRASRHGRRREPLLHGRSLAQSKGTAISIRSVTWSARSKILAWKPASHSAC
ncbi:hypothetical protein GGE24_007658 [Bradyrhizobium centrosematis]|nr:hypothetical protein [Bradyrhizobium centrosematis]